MTTSRTLVSISLLVLGVVTGMLLEKSTEEEFLKVEETSATNWAKDFTEVEIPSTIDAEMQKAYFYASPSSEPQPLLVSLHSWSFDYHQYDTLAELSKVKGINYIHPDFRGVNNRPQACCGEHALADLDAAIDYAIKNAKVDTARIYVIGRSGGGYATICMFMKSRHNIKKFAAWVPLTDLVNWYDETKARKLKYAGEILSATDSKNGILNVESAILRSPMRWPAPLSKRSRSTLTIYTGVNDGLEGNGPIPITQSINFYNKLLKEGNVSDSLNYVSDDEKLKLLERRKPLADFGQIGDRKICLRKQSNNIKLTIFDGGHEILWQYAFDDLVK